MQELNVKLEVYDGPFDALFKLIEKNKIDIYDIPIAELTDQYIEFIQSLESDDMDSMSEFIVMASTLLEIKSKMLLPKEEKEEEEEEDPREELVRRLLEYKKFKKVAEVLYEKEKTSGTSYFKEADKTVLESVKDIAPRDINEILDGVDLNMLYAAFEEVLKRKEDKKDKIRSGFNSVKKAVFNINDKISYLTDLLVVHKKISFREIFKRDTSKAEVVVTFLAMLELIKIKKIHVLQESVFDEIYLTGIEE